jgi:chromosome segregation ATPase
MSLHDTRRTNFVLSELLIWTKYLQYALQKMYEVAGELDDEKEELKEDLAVAEAKLASNDTELSEAHEEVSRVRHEQQLLQQQVTDLNTRAEQIKTSHIDALRALLIYCKTVKHCKTFTIDVLHFSQKPHLKVVFTFFVRTFFVKSCFTQ